jgi:hypothetical protein
VKHLGVASGKLVWANRLWEKNEKHFGTKAEVGNQIPSMGTRTLSEKLGSVVGSVPHERETTGDA